MALLTPLSQTTIVHNGQHYQFSEIQVAAGSTDTIDVDQSAATGAVAVLHKNGGTPGTATLGTPGGDSNTGLVRITLGGDCTAGRLVLITRHGGVGIGSSKAGT